MPAARQAAARAAHAFPRSDATARNAPRPRPDAAIVSLYRMPPGPNETSKPKPVMHHLLDDLQLHRAHQLQVHFAQDARLPDHVQQRILVLQLAQRDQAGVNVALPRHQRVREHRLEDRTAGVPLHAEAFAGECLRQTRDGADGACGDRVDGDGFRAGIDAHLVGFLMPLAVFGILASASPACAVPLSIILAFSSPPVTLSQVRRLPCAS